MFNFNGTGASMLLTTQKTEFLYKCVHSFFSCILLQSGNQEFLLFTLVCDPASSGSLFLSPLSFFFWETTTCDYGRSQVLLTDHPGIFCGAPTTLLLNAGSFCLCHCLERKPFMNHSPKLPPKREQKQILGKQD